MKKYLVLALGAMLSMTAFGQKTIHDPNAEVRAVGSFHAISVSSGIDLYLANGDEAVAVSARDKESASRIKTVVENGVLKISFDWKEHLISTGSRQLKAYVSFKSIDKLWASGGSDVDLDGVIKGNSLHMGISGGSDFKGKVDVGELDVDQSGGSDIKISGSADKVTIEASGGSDFDGYDLITNTCKVSASGGSDVNITVNKELTADASGASDIHYRGSATKIDARKSGAGDVRKTK